MRRSQRLLCDQQLLWDPEPLQLGGGRHRLRQDRGLRLRDLLHGNSHRVSSPGNLDPLQQLGLHLGSGLHGHPRAVLVSRLGSALQSIGGLQLEWELVRWNRGRLRVEHGRPCLFQRIRLHLEGLRRHGRPVLHIELGRVYEPAGLHAVSAHHQQDERLRPSSRVAGFLAHSRLAKPPDPAGRETLIALL